MHNNNGKHNLPPVGCACHFQLKTTWRNVLPSVILRALCEFAAMAREYEFDRDDVLSIAAEGKEYIDSMSDKDFAGMERGVYYQRIAEGLESIGCDGDAEAMRKLAQEWFEWQETAEEPQEYSDFERAYMAAEAGNAECQLWLGKLYLEGNYVWESQLLGTIRIALSAANEKDRSPEDTAESMLGLGQVHAWTRQSLSIVFLTSVKQITNCKLRITA